MKLATLLQTPRPPPRALGFVEVFPPMSLDAYLAQVYENPDELIK